jgi:uncharacterized protein (TIGR01244 family)
MSAFRDAPPQPNWVVSGALNQTDVENLRKAGVKHVIDLRTEEETPDFDEARIVAEQGLMYHPIPIKGVESLTKVNAQKLDALFEQIGAEPALIHCSSGNRVGALIAVRATWIKGRPVDAAITEAKRWGLTRLEGPVRALLETQAQQDEDPDREVLVTRSRDNLMRSSPWRASDTAFSSFGDSSGALRSRSD